MWSCESSHQKPSGEKPTGRKIKETIRTYLIFRCLEVLTARTSQVRRKQVGGGGVGQGI